MFLLIVDHIKRIIRYQSKSVDAAGALSYWAVVFVSVVSFSKHYNNNGPCNCAYRGESTIYADPKDFVSPWLASLLVLLDFSWVPAH